MTIDQKRKILVRIQAAEADIETLRQVKIDIAKNGTASATMSGANGSKSYTRLDLTKIQETIATLTREVRRLRGMLATDGNGGTFPARTIYKVYCD